MEANPIQVMCQYQGGPIVAVVVIKGKRMYDAIQGRHDPCAGGAPDIDAQVEAPWPFPGIEVLTAGIKRTMLSISAHAITGLILSESVVGLVREEFRIPHLS